MSFSSGIRVVLASAIFVGLTALERRFPLRHTRYPANRRFLINAAIGVSAFGVVALAYRAVVLSAVGWAEAHRFGLVRWLRLPSWLAPAAAVIVLDYTLWVWHWLNHRVPLLWRFHAAHHADLDLDASTALRFHPGEMLLSLPFRAVQVAVIGVSFTPLVVWELVTFLCVQFQHSNLRLPARVDRTLSCAIITPRLHGIHHSRRPGELHANFGTIFAFWDRFHRLRITDVPQDTIDIGLPQQPPATLGLGDSLVFPFQRRALIAA